MKSVVHRRRLKSVHLPIFQWAWEQRSRRIREGRKSRIRGEPDFDRKCIRVMSDRSEDRTRDLLSPLPLRTLDCLDKRGGYLEGVLGSLFHTGARKRFKRCSLLK